VSDLVRLPTRLRRKQSHENRPTSSFEFPWNVTPLSGFISLTLGDLAANMLRGAEPTGFAHSHRAPSLRGPRPIEMHQQPSVALWRPRHVYVSIVFFPHIVCTATSSMPLCFQLFACDHAHHLSRVFSSSSESESTLLSRAAGDPYVLILVNPVHRPFFGIFIKFNYLLQCYLQRWLLRRAFAALDVLFGCS